MQTKVRVAALTVQSIGAYHQDFDNYIFANTLDQFEDFRLICYAAADATFTGVDGEIRHQFTPDFGVSMFGDYVRATLAYKLELGPKANAELFVRANNLTNDLAFNHASFIKNASPLRGRNFTFGLRTAF